MLGIEAVAFKLREDEDYLSAAWLEYFDGERDKQITSTVNAFRKSNFKPTAKSGFALGRAGSISEACFARNRRIRIIHERTDDLEAHVAVRHWPPDDHLLLEEMATRTWCELVMNRDVDSD